VFDLIEVDLAGARDAFEHGRLLEATVSAARALLVTQGEQARDEREALELFARHFLEGGLLPASFAALIDAARASLDSRGSAPFRVQAGEVSRLIEAVAALYQGMDASLRFKPAVAETAPPAVPSRPWQPVALHQADFRGVVCPLNYVKTKRLLDGLPRGDLLSVLFDEAGAQNVPASVEKDGHKVLSVEHEADQWRLLIRKA
jgi:sulfite reductase (ferredoxin)